MFVFSFVDNVLFKRFFKTFVLLIVIIVVSSCQSEVNNQKSNKLVIGAEEKVELLEAQLTFVGRVDTGAKWSSINATDIVVNNDISDPKGQPISFRVLSRSAKSQPIQTQIHSVIKIRTSEGSDRRYMVPLTLKWQGITKKVLVNLNDRSRMSYKLLLGRNWLSDDFIVDVDK